MFSSPVPPPASAPGIFGLQDHQGGNPQSGLFPQQGFEQQPMFGGPIPQTQQPTNNYQQPTNNSMGKPSVPSGTGGAGLSSLFTDLDPLGSGKAKPFVDRKDFFSEAKTKKLTGATSEDSLSNKAELDVKPSDNLDGNSDLI